ncbi:MAG: YitT family protein [Clostridia bacterium]|nr:YitT family protein [Clostridia bacterium]
MKKNKKFDLKRWIIEIIGTILGAFVMAFGISLFLLPNQLSSGGISGIATITYYLFNFPMGMVILVINLPLFVFSGYKLGRNFLTKGIIGTTSLSIFIDLLDKIEPITNDRVLACVYGGIIIGLGNAIILKVNASTGGSDLIGTIVAKYSPRIRTGDMIIFLDIIVVIANTLVFQKIEIGLYSAIVIFLMGKVIDIVFEGVNFSKLILIVSDKSAEISKEIEQKIRRGVTGIYGKGMYTNVEKLILLCAVSRKDVSKVKIIAKKIDKHSFIIITNSREVVGLGFKKIQ